MKIKRLGQSLTSLFLALALFNLSPSVTHAQHITDDEPGMHRLSLGADFNVGIDMRGGHLMYERGLLSWSLGTIGLGALLGFHVYTSPDLGYVETEADRFRATTRLSLLLGHHFYVWSQRLSIGTHLFTGPSLFMLSERYKNAAIGLDEERDAASLFGEAGIMASLGYRFGAKRSVGLNLEALMPLYVTGKTQLLHMWFVSTPFFGASLVYYH